MMKNEATSSATTNLMVGRNKALRSSGNSLKCGSCRNREALFRPTIKLVVALLVVSSSISRADENIPADQPPVDYVREVQPLFRKHCLECHGPTKQESDFRVDVRDKLLQGGDFGEPAIVPGASNDSPLVKFIRGDDPDLIMPPEGERLSADEIALLRAWINQGAMMPEAAGTRPTTGHWSFQPL